MSQSPADPFEFLKSLWGPFGQPMAGMVAPTLDPVEIERRITELKSVENWLNLNLNVVRMTIQGMEMQKAALAAVKSGMADSAKAMQAAGASAMQAAGSPPSPADSWMEILRKAQEAAEQARQQQAGGKRS